MPFRVTLYYSFNLEESIRKILDVISILPTNVWLDYFPDVILKICFIFLLSGMCKEHFPTYVTDITKL